MGGKEDQEVTICGSGSDKDNSIICEDTLISHPACEFGGLCECEVFVNAPESTGCDDISENEDNMENADPSNLPGTDKDGDVITENMRRDCENQLSKSPACKFGKLCECKEFANDPSSTGCGGVFTSRFGDTSVDEMCPSYCGVCHEQASSPGVSSLLVVAALLFFSTFMQL